MPQALPFLITAVGLAVPQYATAAAILSIGASLALNVRAQRHDVQFTAPDPGKLLNFRDTQAAIPIVYGRVKIGGNHVFLHSTGENNKYLHIIQTIGEGEIDEVEEICLDDKPIGDYGSNVYYELFKGTPDQVMCDTLYQVFNDWDDYMRHTAYLYLRFEYDGEKFASFPIVTALTRARKVYDPRTELTAWTQNPALIVYDFCTNPLYGVGISTDFWDEDSVKDAANWFDTKGYQINCVIAQQRAGLDTAQQILNSCRAALIWSDGLFKILPLDWDAPVMTLTEDDIKSDSFKFHVPGVSDFPNALRLKFKDKANGYIDEDLVLHNPDAIALDGEQREQVISILDTDYEQIAKLGAYHLDRMRLNRVYSFIAGPKAIPLEPGDIIKVTHNLTGWSQKEVRVQDARILPNFEVALTLLEEEAALYDDTVNISAHSEWTTTLPDPLGVPPPVANVQITEEGFTIKDNTFIRVKVAWDDPPGYGFLDHVEVWVSQVSGGPYTNMGKHYGSFTLETAHDEETWYIKLISVSTYGIKMDLVTTSPYQYTTIGKTNLPADVTGLSGSVADDTVHLIWQEVSMTDLFAYEIRLGAHWNTSILLGKTKSEMWSLVGVKPGTHTFLVKAVDTLNQYSANAAYVTVKVFYPAGYSQKHSFYDDFENGTHNNTEVIEDPAYGTILKVDHTGGLSGDYTSPVFDMGTIKACRHWLEFDIVSGSLWTQVLDPGELWNEAISIGETWIQFFSKEPSGTVEIKFFHSKDQQTWHEIGKFEILSAEVEARYIKWQIFLTDSDETKYLYIKPCTEKAYYWQ